MKKKFTSGHVAENDDDAVPTGSSPFHLKPQETSSSHISIHDPPPLSPKPCPGVLSGFQPPDPTLNTSIEPDFDVVLPPPACRTMFLRTVSRAVPRSTAATRAAPTAVNTLQTRAASDHAIPNPTLANIEKRWEVMPPQEQAELWMQLRDRMKVDWHQMTLQEKKAASPFDYPEASEVIYLGMALDPSNLHNSYYIAFGAHGPRAQAPKGEGLRVFFKVAQLTAVSVAIFYGIHSFAGKQPGTMSKEWQEASNEYALKEKINPIHGISKEGYEGKGFVQSPPAEKS
ncbi:Cytochrome c oxidase subunit IV family [Penicillium cf. griseofulvum]|nr:Cytochrome c oxidase subunit IV family [Penicillium cf. griseofulvum]